MKELREALEPYQEHLRALDRSPNTIKKYCTGVTIFLRWLDGRGLDQAAVLAYRDHLTSTCRPRTVQAHFIALSLFFEWLERTGLVTALPRLKGIRLPRLDPPQRHMPTDTEVQALFTAAARLPGRLLSQRFQRARAQAILALFTFCGIRRSELLRLDVADVLNTGAHADQWRVRIRKGKGLQYRQVPVNAECREFLAAYLTIRSEWAADRERRGLGLSGDAAAALFPSTRSGARMSENILAELYHCLNEAAGHEQPLTPHCLRAWFITRTAANVDVVTAAKLAGHSSVTTTIAHYLKTDAERMQRAVDGLSVNGSGPAPVPVPEVERPAVSKRDRGAFYQQRRHRTPTAAR